MFDEKKLTELAASIHTFDADDNTYLFANYANRLWKLTIDEKCCLGYLLSGDFNSAKNMNEKGFDTEAFFAHLYDSCVVKNADSFNDSINSMVLLVSEACNFACTYCYGVYGEKNAKMSLEIAIKAVDLAISLGVSDIVFFGGEPLTNFEVIKGVVDYVENFKKIDVNFRMTTNASLVTDEYASYFKDHNFEVSVSMDGNRDSHDLTRVYKNGASTYDDVIRGISLLKEYGVLSLLEVTYSARHSELTEQLRTALDLYPVVSCACVDGKCGSKHENDIISGERLKTFYNKLLDFEKNNLKENEMLIGARELFDKICDGNILMQPKYLCSDIGTRLIVSPNGNIVPCPEMTHEADYVIANVQNISSPAEFLEKRQSVLDALSSTRINKCWFSGLCETCIQHVKNEDGRFIYTQEESFSDCVEDLLIRFIRESNE